MGCRPKPLRRSMSTAQEMGLPPKPRGDMNKREGKKINISVS